MYSETVTLTSANVNYNLLSLILAARGYTIPVLTSPPMIQVKIDGSSSYFPNPVRELHYKGDAGNGASIIDICDASGNIGDSVQASQSNTIRQGLTQSVDLSMYYVSCANAGAKLNVLVEL